MKIIEVNTPMWFIHSEIGIQLIFAIVTLLIAIYAYKTYRIARQQKSLYFGIGFLGISIAYFIQAIFNFLLLRKISTCGMLSFLAGHSIETTMTLSIFVVFIHMLFMITGFAILAHLTLKEKNVKSLYLVWIVSLIALFFAANLSLVFYIILTVLLGFITLQYDLRFIKKPRTETFLVFLGFGLLFLGIIQLALATRLSTLYISGHLVTLTGYILLLVNLIRIVKK